MCNSKYSRPRSIFQPIIKWQSWFQYHPIIFLLDRDGVIWCVSWEIPPDHGVPQPKPSHVGQGFWVQLKPSWWGAGCSTAWLSIYQGLSPCSGPDYVIIFDMAQVLCPSEHLNFFLMWVLLSTARESFWCLTDDNSPLPDYTWKETSS